MRGWPDEGRHDPLDHLIMTPSWRAGHEGERRGVMGGGNNLLEGDAATEGVGGGGGQGGNNLLQRDAANLGRLVGRERLVASARVEVEAVAGAESAGPAGPLPRRGLVDPRLHQLPQPLALVVSRLLYAALGV